MKPTEMMGRLVSVDAVYRKEKRWIVPSGMGPGHHQLSYLVVSLTESRTGWYVGERNLRTGKVRPGGYDDPPCFEGGGNIKAHAVVFWPTMAPVLVPHGLMNLSLGTPGKCGHPLPYPPGGSPKDREFARKAYRDQSAHYPRDAKGRFISG